MDTPAAATPDPSPVILRADAMLTPTGVVAPAELEFTADRITYAGTPRTDTAPTHDLRGRVLMPGLVNGHTHSAMTLLRGVSDDEGFMPWLADVQAREQHLVHDDVVAGLELAMLEMIASGTTAFADMYHWDAPLIDRVRSAGMRVLAAPACFTAEAVGFPGVSPLSGAETLDVTEELAKQYAGDPLVRLAYGPHAPYTSPPEFLRSIAERSRATDIPIHIHVAESVAEIRDMTARYGTTPGKHLTGLGFGDAEVLAAHCVHLTEEEIADYAAFGTAVSHNPVSNLKLGCGIAPLPAFMSAGLRLALGTDSVASNNSLDLFEEIKTASILHRGHREDAGVIRAVDILDIATRRGAEAIGFPDTGALEVGRLADVIALDTNGVPAAPFSPDALVSHLGFTATGRDVRNVFIGGRLVYVDGEHLTLDRDDIVRRARASAARLRTPNSDENPT